MDFPLSRVGHLIESANLKFQQQESQIANWSYVYLVLKYDQRPYDGLTI